MFFYRSSRNIEHRRHWEINRRLLSPFTVSSARLGLVGLVRREKKWKRREKRREMVLTFSLYRLCRGRCGNSAQLDRWMGIPLSFARDWRSVPHQNCLHVTCKCWAMLGVIGKPSRLCQFKISRCQANFRFDANDCGVNFSALSTQLVGSGPSVSSIAAPVSQNLSRGATFKFFFCFASNYGSDPLIMNSIWDN